MILSNVTLKGINPASVSGSILIGGESVPYNRGHLSYKGVQYLISDDHGLVIDTRRRIFGAVVNNRLVPLNDLSAGQLLDLHRRYGVSK